MNLDDREADVVLQLLEHELERASGSAGASSLSTDGVQLLERVVLRLRPRVERARRARAGA